MHDKRLGRVGKRLGVGKRSQVRRRRQSRPKTRVKEVCFELGEVKATKPAKDQGQGSVLSQVRRRRQCRPKTRVREVF